MSLAMYPKCPDCGRKTTKKYKIDVLFKDGSVCYFCKAKLLPKTFDNWTLKAISAITFGLIAHLLWDFIFPEDIPIFRSLLIFFFALFGIRFIDIFSSVRAFRF